MVQEQKLASAPSSHGCFRIYNAMATLFLDDQRQHQHAAIINKLQVQAAVQQESLGTLICRSDPSGVGEPAIAP